MFITLHYKNYFNVKHSSLFGYEAKKFFKSCEAKNEGLYKSLKQDEKIS
jgi:hypothetical protein